MFKTNNSVFERATQGVPAEKWLEQPGGDSHHLAGMVGHAVVHRALAAKILGSEWSAPWETCSRAEQSGVAEPVSRAEGCSEPGGREVSEKLNCVAKGVCGSTLRAVPRKTGSTARSVSIALLCFHETFHAANSYLRKWLGCGQAAG
jgi:hypothetical protein